MIYACSECKQFFNRDIPGVCPKCYLPLEAKYTSEGKTTTRHSAEPKGIVSDVVNDLRHHMDETRSKDLVIVFSVTIIIAVIWSFASGFSGKFIEGGVWHRVGGNWSLVKAMYNGVLVLVMGYGVYRGVRRYRAKTFWTGGQ